MAPTSHDSRDISPANQALSFRLMIVEDDADHRTTVADILKEEGYDVETATDGRDALGQLARGGPLPDLILVDMLMPVMDGWAFMTELKNDPALSSIPVLVISSAGDRVLCSAPVAAGYLAKPLARDRLLDTIWRCLVRRSQASHAEL